MQVRTLLQSIPKRFTSTSKNLKESIQYLPVLKTRPEVIPLWLKTARAAQVVLLLSIILVPTVLPKILDAGLSIIFPPVTEKKLFGLYERTRENPHLEGAQKAGRVVLYVGAFGSVAVLLLLHLPKAVQYASTTAPVSKRAAEHTILIEPPLPTSSPGERFELIQVLGRGGMGIVHLARDTVLDRKVALKELHTVFGQDEKLLLRFRQEAKILAQLTHPGIVQIYDFLEQQDRFWIVMEYIEGGELSKKLEAPQAPGLVASLGSRMADALAFAHERGVIHRDFKPSNVLLTRDGSPKITDFGIARLAQTTSFTQDGTVLGSPYYMSPEQAEGKTADERSDIYSLGIVLYQALAGAPPFQGESFASVLAQHLNKEPASLHDLVPKVPDKLNSFILRMLAKKPDRRIQTMKDVAEFLRSFS